MKKTIGFLGRPVSGKTTSLYKLSEAYNLSSVQTIFLDEEKDKHLKKLDFLLNNYEISIYALPGPIFYTDEMYKFVLSKADIVFYFFQFEMDYKYDNEVELDYFEHHYYIAGKMNKLWTSIPWQFVLNKKQYLRSTMFETFQFDLKIPVHLKEQTILTDTYRGIGLNLIWERILKLITYQDSVPF